MDTSKVTRLEVIDHTAMHLELSDSARAYGVMSKAIEVSLSLQDDGRTLKVFVKDKEGEHGGFSGEEAKAFAEGTCELCGEPMPEGEKMFKYHGYSGPCPEKRP